MSNILAPWLFETGKEKIHTQIEYNVGINPALASVRKTSDLNDLFSL